MSAFDENPFADPSVQQATASNPAPSAASLENYDPFSQQQKTTSASGGGGGAVSGPAVMSPTQESNPPPPYNKSAQQTVTAADFQVGSLTLTLTVLQPEVFGIIWGHLAAYETLASRYYY